MICRQCQRETGSHNRFCNQHCYDKYNLEAVYNERMTDGKLPADFLKNDGWRNNQEQLYRSVKNKPNCIWIWGESGRGKTRLAYMILYNAGRKRAIETHSAKQLFDHEDKLCNRVYSDVLLIDDVHVMKWTTTSASLFHDFMTRREQRRQQTIITCEYEINTYCAQVKAASGGVLGYALLNRLNCCGERWDLHCVGENLRVNHSETRSV